MTGNTEEVKTIDVNKMRKQLEGEIAKYDLKTFRVMFMVYDSKGTPTGGLANTYETAMVLKNMGYDVAMLYVEKDFVGVGDWLGEEYANLPHYNIEKDNVSISPSDILFIPEVYASVMEQTKKFPCKRIALLNNMKYLADTIPLAGDTTWELMGIRDCVTISENYEKEIKEYFPSVRTNVVSPAIKEIFNCDDADKKFVINIVAKNDSEANEFVKLFYLKYPMLKWVPFQSVQGIPQERMATIFKNSVATVWIDRECSFGYTALQAMACGNIIVGVIPDEEPEWILKNGTIAENGIWTYKKKDLPNMISNLIVAYLHNEKPNKILKNMKDTVSVYSTERFKNTVKEVYVDGIFAERKKELQLAFSAVNNNIEKNKKNG